MDIRVNNQGSIIILTPETDAGRAWCEEHISHAQRWAGGYVVEPRYAENIIDGMQSDDLEVG